MNHERSDKNGGLIHPNIAREIFDWAQPLIDVIVGIILLFIFVAGEFSVNQESMLDTLQPNDILVISNLLYTPQRGDIVMFSKYRVYRSYDPDTGRYTPFVKRVIGIPGDEIQFENGTLFINGEAQSEDYIYEQRWIWLGNMPTSFTVPEGQYFLAGDNRNNSTDSRSSEIGFVDRRCIFGRVLLRLWPLNRFGFV